MPPIETSPEKLALVAVIIPTTRLPPPDIGPSNDVAVTIPDEFMFLDVISPVVIWSSAVNHTLPVLP